MCGIAGQLRFDGQFVEKSLLRRMADTLVHRGPDGDGYFCDGPLGLAHRRLAIIDLAGGAQPMSSGDVTLTFNGEIFNYRDLREVIGAGCFHTNSDTEVILQGYLKWGSDVFRRLNGQYAVAIWDARKQEFLIARDPVGIKPLYYLADQEQLLFASELKAIKVVTSGLTLDERALDLFLAYGYVPAPYTIYKEVRKLEPGMLLRSSPDSGREVLIEPFFPAHDFLKSEEAGFSNVEELGASLEACIRRQLVADVDVGAFLSGGTDSSAVVAAMHRAGRRAPCFTIGFDADGSALGLAREASEKLELPLTTREAERGELLRDLPPLVRHFDEPFASTSVLPTDAVCALAAEHVTVVLSGDGGDELLGGYNKYFRFINQRRSSGARLLARLARFLPGGGSSLRRIQAAGMAPGDHFAAYALQSGRAFRRSLYKEEFSERLGYVEGGEYVSGLWPKDSEREVGAKAGFTDFQSFMVDHVLVKVDRLSMRHSIEARVPILDNEFVARCFATGDNRRFAMDGSKFIAGKKILKDYLRQSFTDSYVDRRKRGFSFPMRAWLGRREVDAVGKKLLSSNGSEIFDETRLKRFLSGVRDNQRSRATLYTLLVLGVWLEDA